ncbi:MAG: trypsin-like serine protease [Candidatus Promineifilaceae bacterium]
MSTTSKYLIRLMILFATVALLASGLSNPTNIVRRQAGNNTQHTQEHTGKTPAQQGQQPWMVSLAERGQNNGYQAHICGASLISPQWVLTAAHCVEDTTASELDLVINRHTLSSNAGERIPAAQIIVHSGYGNNSDGQDNDIALIKLARPSTQGQPIALITDATAQLDDAGAMARVTGWGRVPEQNIEVTDVLHGVNVPMVSQQTCNAVYDGQVTPDAICAGYANGGADSCQGDSGGPLIVPNGNSWVQVGIVSWGGDLGCGVAGQYGVYARLTEYDSWIQSKVGSLQAPTTPTTPAPTTPAPTTPAPTTPAPTAPATSNWAQLAPAGYEFEGSYQDGDDLVVLFGNDSGEYIDLVVSSNNGQSLDDYLVNEGNVWETTINGVTVLVEDLGDWNNPYSIAVFEVDGNIYTIEGTINYDTIAKMATQII